MGCRQSFCRYFLPVFTLQVGAHTTVENTNIIDSGNTAIDNFLFAISFATVKLLLKTGEKRKKFVL
jgi:hypothetical protein